MIDDVCARGVASAVAEPVNETALSHATSKDWVHETALSHNHQGLKSARPMVARVALDLLGLLGLFGLLG